MTAKDRRAAKGQICTLRVSGYGGCSGSDSTILAHAPSAEDGKGFKSPDWWAAFSCSRCHDLIDKRTKITESIEREDGEWIRQQRYLTQAEIDAAWNRGIFETIRLRRLQAEKEDDYPF